MIGRRLAPVSSARCAPSLLAVAVALPLAAVAWGRLDGRLAFVLYREPKLVAAQLVGWALLSVLVFRAPPRADLIAVLRRPPVVLLGAFLLWAAATTAWARVYANGHYELCQYLLLAPLAVLLAAAARRRPALATAIEGGLLAAVLAASAIGLVQRLVPLPWLLPINPLGEVAHPSLLGYKNPMALAVLGQLFWLAGRAWVPSGSARLRLLAAAALALETVYLLSLRSRTAYLACAAGAVVLVALEWSRGARAAGGGRRGLRRLAAALGALALLVALAAAADRAARARLASAGSILARPWAYLETDRGVYLRNTLNMVRHRPLGVGLGDWQTHYPVYRLHGRDRWFDREVQVRRAHSDHVQLLGETGWPGLALWLAFWLALLAATVSAARGGARRAPFDGAQVAAWVTAMGTDYVIEHPYLKWQAFLVVAVTLAATARGRSPAASAGAGGRPGQPRLGAVLVLLAALVNGVYSVGLGCKVHAAASLTARYREAAGLDPPAAAAALQAVVRLGALLEGLPGHAKTLYRDHLVVAHAAHLSGRAAVAEAHARRALALHPHHPNAMLLLADVVALTRPRVARRLRADAAYVLERASHGFAPPSTAPVAGEPP